MNTNRNWYVLVRLWKEAEALAEVDRAMNQTLEVLRVQGIGSGVTADRIRAARASEARALRLFDFMNNFHRPWDGNETTDFSIPRPEHAWLAG